MKEKILTLLCVLSLVPVSVYSAETKPASTQAAAAQPKSDLSDPDIDIRVKHVDEILKGKIEEINNDFAEMQAYEKKANNNRIDFEKKLADDKKNKLKELKQRDQKERKVLLNAFNYRQKRERQGFIWKENINRKKEIRRLHKTKTASHKKDSSKKK